MKSIIVLSTILALTYGRQGFGSGSQDWGYVTVRPKAHTFWWLYETTAHVQSITQRPLVIWLQGGPGSSSTGFGNFAELGPLDIDLKPRNHTWVKDMNVLYIDNPVGTGYSYVEDISALTTTNQQIAEDLVACLEGFYQKRPEFRNVSLYITSQSYGGKMAVDFALELHKRNHSGQMLSKLKGVTLINPWISPVDSVVTWGPYLYHVGAVDKKDYEAIQEVALDAKLYVDEGKFIDATVAWYNTQMLVLNLTHNIDFYNILTKILSSSPARQLAKPDVNRELSEDEKINNLMNGDVKEALNINITWGAQKDNVFMSLIKDFMKPVTDGVEKLLNETDLVLQVVSGQLDLIVDTPGTVRWVDHLKWSRRYEWRYLVNRNVLSVNGINEGYQKVLGRFSMYSVNRAGHMVPADNPAAMSKILEKLFNT